MRRADIAVEDVVRDAADSKGKRVSINKCLKKMNRRHKQRLSFVGPYIGMELVLLFALFLVPLYSFLICFNRVYF